MSGSPPGRWAVVILAAGQGKRMRSATPKVLHHLAGRPIIDHVLDSALTRAEADDVVVVVGHQASQVTDHVARRGVRTVLQQPQLGTGDAVRVGLTAVDPTRCDRVLVLCGDVPLLRPQTLDALRLRLVAPVECVLLTAVLDDPAAYGRIRRNNDGTVAAIVEARDAEPETLAITEVNAGTYAFSLAPLAAALGELTPENDQGEYYLTDVVAVLGERAARVEAVILSSGDEMLGINSRQDLAEAGRVLNRRVLDELMRSGVSVCDPLTTWVEPGCTVEPDTILEPGVILSGGTRVGRGARIGAWSVLDGVIVPPGESVPPLSRRQ